MEFFVQNHLSDDQWALIGCAAALLLCGTFMSLSYFIGRARESSARRAFGKTAADHSFSAQTAAPKPRRKAA